MYVCKVEECGKCFSRGEHLKRHIRSIHTHEKRESGQNLRSSKALTMTVRQPSNAPTPPVTSTSTATTTSCSTKKYTKASPHPRSPATPPTGPSTACSRDPTTITHNSLRPARMPWRRTHSHIRYSRHTTIARPPDPRATPPTWPCRHCAPNYLPRKLSPCRSRRTWMAPLRCTIHAPLTSMRPQRRAPRLPITSWAMSQPFLDDERLIGVVEIIR